MRSALPWRGQGQRQQVLVVRALPVVRTDSLSSSGGPRTVQCSQEERQARVLQALLEGRGLMPRPQVLPVAPAEGCTLWMLCGHPLPAQGQWGAGVRWGHWSPRTDSSHPAVQAKAAREEREAWRLRLRSLQYLERYVYLILFNAYLHLEKAASWQRPFSTWMREVRRGVPGGCLTGLCACSAAPAVPVRRVYLTESAMHPLNRGETGCREVA